MPKTAPKPKGFDKLTKGKKYGVGPIQLTPYEWGAVGLGSYFIYSHFIRPTTAAENAAADTSSGITDYASAGMSSSGGASGGGGSGGGGSGGGGGGGPKPCPPGTERGPKGACRPKCPKGQSRTGPRGGCMPVGGHGSHPCPHLSCGPRFRKDLKNCRCVPVGGKPPPPVRGVKGPGPKPSPAHVPQVHDHRPPPRQPAPSTRQHIRMGAAGGKGGTIAR